MTEERDFGRQHRYSRFRGRVVVLSILVLLLYPFLWAWTIIGTLWFAGARGCLPADGQKWGFLIWLLFSYCGLFCIGCFCEGKWLSRRRAHLLRAQHGIPISEFGVFLDMIRVPDWAFEAAGQELRAMGQDAATYHPGLYLTTAQLKKVSNTNPTSRSDVPSETVGQDVVINEEEDAHGLKSNKPRRIWVQQCSMLLEKASDTSPTPRSDVSSETARQDVDMNDKMDDDEMKSKKRRREDDKPQMKSKNRN